MNSFVLIFRQGPKKPPESAMAGRAEQTLAWARDANRAGYKLRPHVLTPEAVAIGSKDGATPAGDAWPVIALIFCEAESLNSAAQLAGSHPVLNYGCSAEVRAWSPVGPGAAVSAQ